MNKTFFNGHGCNYRSLTRLKVSVDITFCHNGVVILSTSISRRPRSTVLLIVIHRIAALQQPGAPTTQRCAGREPHTGRCRSFCAPFASPAQRIWWLLGGKLREVQSGGRGVDPVKLYSYFSKSTPNIVIRICWDQQNLTPPVTLVEMTLSATASKVVLAEFQLSAKTQQRCVVDSTRNY